MSASTIRVSVFSGMGYLFGDDPTGEFMPDWSDELDDCADAVLAAAVAAKEASPARTQEDK